MVQKIKDAEGNLVAELLKDEDITSNLHGKVLAVIGYASQGRGQSLCYRDSGVNIIIGVRTNGESWNKALEDGWSENETLFDIEEAVKRADIIELLISDTAQPEVFKEIIEGTLREGQMLVFSHGFNIHFKGIIPPSFVDVALLAPKGPGFTVRSEYENGFGVPVLVGVSQNPTGNAWDLVLAMAKALNASKAGVFKTSFKDEVESDLFGEQVDLCGGVVEMVKHAFNTLVESGYNPVLAYWEVSHELYGLIAPLAYKYGNYGMLNRVSLTARKGALSRGKVVMTDVVKKNMEHCLKDIQSGKFAKEWMDEYAEHGYDLINKELDQLKNHPLEVIGKQVRQVMWPNNESHV